MQGSLRGRTIARPRTMSTPVPAIRSALFVPAHRTDFLAKVDRGQADAVILDLEDGVDVSRRQIARESAATWLSERDPAGTPACFARINPVDAGHLEADLEAVVHASTTAILVPKVQGADDVQAVERALAYREGRQNLTFGQTKIWPLLESSGAIRRADDIMTASDRIAYAGGGTAAGGDLARDLGFEVTVEGLETLFLRSALLVAARSAGVANPMTGIHTAIDDPDGLRAFAEASRRLGYEGMMVIHPSHAAIVNEVFTPSPSAVADARQVLDALQAASAAGHGAVQVNGRMVDVAMAASAQRVVDRWHGSTPS